MLSRPYKLGYTPSYMAYQKAFIQVIPAEARAATGPKQVGNGTLKTSGSAGIGAGGSTATTGYRQPNNAGTKIRAVGDAGVLINPASGCKNCKQWDIPCELHKALICEPNAAIKKDFDRGSNAAGAVGQKLQDILGGNANAIQDSIGGTANMIQDVLGGNANAIQEWFNSGNWLVPVAVVGGLLIILVVVKR